MAKMVIRKRVSFDFLGEDYKDCYVVLRSIPVTDYETIGNTIDKESKAVKKTTLVLKLLKENFISGEFLDENDKLAPLKRDDLDGIDGDALLELYNRIMGVPDPKLKGQSETSLNQTDA